MTDRLHFTGREDADKLLVEDPFALLVGFALDQQVPVQKAFMGPYVLRERLGIARRRGRRRRRPRPDLPRAPRDPPLPGRDGHARARARRSTSSSATTATRRGCGRTRRARTSCATTSPALPGYGTMKIKALGSVLFNRFGVELAQPLIPWHPTLGDVDSPRR